MFTHVNKINSQINANVTTLELWYKAGFRETAKPLSKAVCFYHVLLQYNTRYLQFHWYAKWVL